MRVKKNNKKEIFDTTISVETQLLLDSLRQAKKRLREITAIPESYFKERNDG